MTTNSIESVFEGKDPTLRATFDYLLQQLQHFGAVKVAPKKTSIHLEKNSGFAGVHPRKSYFNGAHFDLLQVKQLETSASQKSHLVLQPQIYG